jgi:hypothetical protein
VRAGRYGGWARGSWITHANRTATREHIGFRCGDHRWRRLRRPRLLRAGGSVEHPGAAVHAVAELARTHVGEPTAAADHALGTIVEVVEAKLFLPTTEVERGACLQLREAAANRGRRRRRRRTCSDDGRAKPDEPSKPHAHTLLHAAPVLEAASPLRLTRHRRLGTFGVGIGNATTLLCTATPVQFAGLRPQTLHIVSCHTLALQAQGAEPHSGTQLRTLALLVGCSDAARTLASLALPLDAQPAALATDGFLTALHALAGSGEAATTFFANTRNLAIAIVSRHADAVANAATPVARAHGGLAAVPRTPRNTALVDQAAQAVARAPFGRLALEGIVSDAAMRAVVLAAPLFLTGSRLRALGQRLAAPAQVAALTSRTGGHALTVTKRRRHACAVLRRARTARSAGRHAAAALVRGGAERAAWLGHPHRASRTRDLPCKRAVRSQHGHAGVAVARHLGAIGLRHRLRLRWSWRRRRTAGGHSQRRRDANEQPTDAVSPNHPADTTAREWPRRRHNSNRAAAAIHQPPPGRRLPTVQPAHPPRLGAGRGCETTSIPPCTM